MKRIAICTLFAVVLLCTGMCYTVMAAATSSSCKHNNTRRYGETVSNWTVSHTVTLSASQGPQTCYGTAWVEKVTEQCLDCGHSWEIDTYMHERHTLCGINY